MAGSIHVNAQSRLGCPVRPNLVERGGQTVLFSPETLTGVRVDGSGREVLEEIANGDTPHALAARLARKHRTSTEEILKTLVPFLQRMVDDQYLWLADSPPAMDSAYPEAEFKPFQMYLHLTHACNQSCIYCYNADYRRAAAGPELAFSQLTGLLKEARELGVREVVFTGGEPLLRPEVFELAAWGRELGMRLGLLTNGTLVSERGAEVIAGAFDSIFVSLDSCREDQHDRLRGKDSHRRAAEGVRQLCALEPEKVCIRPVLTRHNFDALPEFPAWAASETGCKTILPVIYQPGSLAELTELGLMPDMSELAPAYEAFKTASATTGVSNALSCVPLRSRGACGAGSQIISVDASGEVFPCQALHFPELSGGNIQRQTLPQIGMAPSLRRFARVSVRSIPKCRDCSLNAVCGGGCRALAYALYGDIHAHNEFFCPILKQDAEDRLWEESEKSRRSVPGAAE